MPNIAAKLSLNVPAITALCKGAPGTSIRNGTGVPDPLSGNDGDFYLDTVTYGMYGPKSGGAWGTPTLLSNNFLAPRWDSSFNTLTALSASWVSTYTTVQDASARWSGVYSTTRAYSGDWNSAFDTANNVYSVVNVNSGGWGSASDVFTTVNANSANWDNTYNTVNNYSPQWSSTYSSVYANSASWNTDLGVRALTGDWESTHSSVYANSALWDAAAGSAGADVAVRSLTANWESTYSAVYANSGNWESVYTSFGSQSGNNNGMFTAVRAGSAAWNDTNTTVWTYSAGWGGSVIDTSKYDATYSTVYNLSSNWEGTYQQVTNDSQRWYDTSSTVQGNSGTWGLTLPSFRNKIINGNFDIWQRGTTLGSGTGDRYLADRFVNGSIGSTYTASRQVFSNGQTDVPNNPNYYHRTVVSSVAGNGNYCLVRQRIESVKTLAGQTATLSFYAKADANKPISIEFVQSFGTGGTPSSIIESIGVQKLNLTTSWQKFTVTANIPSIAGKTIGTINDDYLAIRFWFSAGSDFNANTNSLGQQSGTFDIAQIQLEEDLVDTPFEVRPIGTELALCQRYYQAFTAGVTLTLNSSPWVPFIYSFPVTMRATPTVTNQNINTPIVNVDGIFATGAIGSNTSTPINSNFTALAEL